MEAPPEKKKENMIPKIRQCVDKWKSEIVRNEEYMEQIWRNKEARMKELEELERMKCSLVFDSEDENEEHEEKEKKIEEKVVKCQEEVIVEQSKSFKPQKEVDFETALAAVIKPFNLQAMDVDDLKKKAKELYDIAVKMIVDKYMFEELIKDQRQKLEDLNEQLDEKMRAKHAKKGVDMHKFYPTKRVHPPKMSIFSKFDKRKGERLVPFTLTGVPRLASYRPC